MHDQKFVLHLVASIERCDARILIPRFQSEEECGCLESSHSPTNAIVVVERSILTNHQPADPQAEENSTS